jgi:hypothetical protein
MIEITDKQEVADLHIQALGQFDETEEYIPSSSIWVAIIKEEPPQGMTHEHPVWFLVTDEAIGGDRAWQFTDEQEAMDSFGEIQELFRTWLESKHTQDNTS